MTPNDDSKQKPPFSSDIDQIKKNIQVILNHYFRYFFYDFDPDSSKQDFQFRFNLRQEKIANVQNILLSLSKKYQAKTLLEIIPLSDFQAMFSRANQSQIENNSSCAEIMKKYIEELYQNKQPLSNSHIVPDKIVEDKIEPVISEILGQDYLFQIPLSSKERLLGIFKFDFFSCRSTQPVYFQIIGYDPEHQLFDQSTIDQTQINQTQAFLKSLDDKTQTVTFKNSEGLQQETTFYLSPSNSYFFRRLKCEYLAARDPEFFFYFSVSLMNFFEERYWRRIFLTDKTEFFQAFLKIYDHYHTQLKAKYLPLSKLPDNCFLSNTNEFDDFQKCIADIFAILFDIGFTLDKQNFYYFKSHFFYQATLSFTCEGELVPQLGVIMPNPFKPQPKELTLKLGHVLKPQNNKKEDWSALKELKKEILLNYLSRDFATTFYDLVLNGADIKAIKNVKWYDLEIQKFGILTHKSLDQDDSGLQCNLKIDLREETIEEFFALDRYLTLCSFDIKLDVSKIFFKRLNPILKLSITLKYNPLRDRFSSL